MQCDSMSTQRLCDTVACIENFKQDIIEDSIATVKDITPDESAECFLDSLQAMRERLHLYDRDYDSFDRWAHLWHGFSEKPTMHEFVLLCTLFIDCKSEAEVSGVRERQYPYLIEHPDFFENVSVWFNAMPKELRYDFLRNLSSGVFIEATYQKEPKTTQELVEYLQDKVPDFFEVLKDNEMEVSYKGIWVYFGENDSIQPELW